MTLQEILALLADPSGLTDVQIGELEAELRTIAAEIEATIAAGEATPETIMDYASIADAVEGLQALAGERIAEADAAAEAAAAEQAEIDAMLEEVASRIAGEQASDVPVEDAPEEGDPDEGGDGDAEPDEVEAEVVPEPVAAAAAPAPRPVAQPARPSGRFTPRPEAHPSVRMRRTGGGDDFENVAEIGRALFERADDFMGGGGGDGRSRVARITAEFAQDRVIQNAERVDNLPDYTHVADQVRRAASSGDAAEIVSLTADGGVCAVAENWYDFQRIATAGRELRDSVPGYNARRGGLAFVPPAQLSSVGTAGTGTTNAIGAMTNAQDIAAATDKSYQVISCGTQTTVTVDAVWRQYENGNMASRFNPERQTEFAELVLASYARFNEQRLWTKMLALSTVVDLPQRLGATRDLIVGLNRAAVNYRGVHRMAKDATVEIRIPSWAVRGLLPDDMTNTLQADEYQMHVTFEWVRATLAEKNIVIAAEYNDDFTTAIANGGGLNAYPSVLKVIMNHPGAFFYLDGGELDLGVFRDSTLVNNNTFRVFAEEFWNVGMWGLQALALQFSLCANGASAGSRTPVCGS